MNNFDLKKAILENKATFFSSLTEGQFSWFTQDTEQQIGSERENTLPFVYMHDDKGNKWLEKNYEGYGEFGGKDYYELLDQMNGGSGDRSEGIRLAFDNDAIAAGKVSFPALTISATLPNGHDFTKEAENDPNQSWYAEEEEEEDDYYSNRYGDEDEDDLVKLSDLAEGKQLKEETDDSIKTDTPIKKSKMKKETVDSKLAEIEKQSQVVALEAKIAAIDEMIDTKNQRISMISEDENLSELVDKAKMKVMQREVKDLERRKAKIEKLYEKMCGKSYTKEEIVDEEMSTELNENKTKMKKSELKEMIKAAMMSEINIDIQDTNADYDFLAEEYEATDHDIQIGPAMAGIVNIRKYLEKSAPEYLSDLKAIDSVLTSYDNKMAYGDDDLGVPGDNALGLEENRSEFDTNKPARITDFLKHLMILYMMNTTQNYT
jgi:hypothetical protein